MKVFVFVILAVAVSARPDIGLTYRAQSTNYGVPSNTYIPVAPTGNYHHAGTHGSSGNTHYQSTTYGQGGSTVGHGGGGFVQGGNIGQGTNFGQGGPISYGSNNYGQTLIQSRFQEYSGPAQVTKHAYFYEAPDEHIGQTRVHVPVAPPRKNVRLIFIKAPAYGSSANIVAPQVQQEEKTLVYVLVKKPDEAQDINIPTPAPTQPSKPEVFFVKYKNQQEAEEKISASLQGSQGAANLANILGSESELVSSIGRDIENSRRNSGVSVENYGFENRFNDAGTSGGGVEVVQPGNAGVNTVTTHYEHKETTSGGAAPVVFDQGPGVSSTHHSSTVTNQHHSGSHPGYNYKK